MRLRQIRTSHFAIRNFRLSPLYNSRVGYQAAVEALQNGDLAAAVPMLESAVRETQYASEAVNHAYTLALYRTGDKRRLADVAFRIANSLLSVKPAAAMDYFQRALFAGLDSSRVRRIGEVYEAWAAPRTGFVPSRVRRVAHVIGCLLPNHAPTHYVKLLSGGLQAQGVESLIFTTESCASWFFNTSEAPQSRDAAIPYGSVIASVQGNFVERAERIAGDIKSRGVDAVFFHGGLFEQIMAGVAALRPAPVQIHVNHGEEMDADLFDGAIRLFKDEPRQKRQNSRPGEWVPQASDIEDRLAARAPFRRRSLGLESAASVSGTFGGLDKASRQSYLHALSAILKRFPKHYHLFAGAGEVRSIRAYLHAEGVLTRVRFLGPMSDLAPLLASLDVYLDSFPESGEQAVVDAMGAGVPVVALRNAAQDVLGVPDLLAASGADYSAIAERVIGNPTLRARYSDAVRTRFRDAFHPSAVAARCLRFLDRVREEVCLNHASTRNA